VQLKCDANTVIYSKTEVHEDDKVHAGLRLNECLLSAL
jgi:hypothetical protein